MMAAMPRGTKTHRKGKNCQPGGPPSLPPCDRDGLDEGEGADQQKDAVARKRSHAVEQRHQQEGSDEHREDSQADEQEDRAKHVQTRDCLQCGTCTAYTEITAGVKIDVA
jgi:hypothetical protein